MDELISPNQNNFILGRKASHNIIIAQEIVHSMQRMKGLKRFMAIKINMEKAFDWIKWDFLIDTLREIGLQKINIIWHCVSSPFMHILWNGSSFNNGIFLSF